MRGKLLLAWPNLLIRLRLQLTILYSGCYLILSIQRRTATIKGAFIMFPEIRYIFLENQKKRQGDWYGPNYSGQCKLLLLWAFIHRFRIFFALIILYIELQSFVVVQLIAIIIIFCDKLILSMGKQYPILKIINHLINDKLFKIKFLIYIWA